MMLGLYRGAATLAAPAVRVVLARRQRRGREDPDRIAERRGVASLARPDGRLIWLHAASIGEAISSLSLIERIAAERPELTLLVTTGTVTSAAIMKSRLPAGALHQYAPVDVPAWVERFLDHWRPDLALWMESEFWPAALMAMQRRCVPVVLVNARVSDRSFRGWRRAPGAIASLLGCFALCLAQSPTDGERLTALGAGTVEVPGNLKFSAAALPADAAALETLRAAVGARPVWLAANTHPGEDEAVAAAHRAVAEAVPDLLTVIVPRHPARGPDIERMLRDRGFRVARRAAGNDIAADTEIYLADTVGELGLFYRFALVAFIGGSLVPHGGQNPLEAARLDCAILHGPHMENFAAIEAELRAAGATLAVASAEALGPAVAALLADTSRRDALARAAADFAESQTGILDAVVAALAPYLDALAPPTAPDPAEHVRSRA